MTIFFNEIEKYHVIWHDVWPQKTHPVPHDGTTIDTLLIGLALDAKRLVLGPRDEPLIRYNWPDAMTSVEYTPTPRRKHRYLNFDFEPLQNLTPAAVKSLTIGRRERKYVENIYSPLCGQIALHDPADRRPYKESPGPSFSVGTSFPAAGRIVGQIDRAITWAQAYGPDMGTIRLGRKAVLGATGDYDQLHDLFYEYHIQCPGQVVIYSHNSHLDNAYREKYNTRKERMAKEQEEWAKMGWRSP